MCRGEEEPPVAASCPAPTERVSGETEAPAALTAFVDLAPASPSVGEVWLDTAMPLPSHQEEEEEEEEDLHTRFSSSTAWYVIFAVARSPL